jgi:organic hydroperoxide reductase OsmC/OhrA
LQAAMPGKFDHVPAAPGSPFAGSSNCTSAGPPLSPEGLRALMWISAQVMGHAKFMFLVALGAMAMQDFPHKYKVAAAAGTEADVSVTGDRLEALACAAPAQFGGPGDKWSPETLLTAAVASCFVLTFRAIARASKLDWTTLKCEVEGTLERRDGKSLFTEFAVQATLSVPADTNEDRAMRLLDKAEQTCLVTNSLSAQTHLKALVLKASR